MTETTIGGLFRIAGPAVVLTSYGMIEMRRPHPFLRVVYRRVGSIFVLGGICILSNWEIYVEYQTSTNSSDPLTESAALLNPWTDPSVGKVIATLTPAITPQHRVAVSVRTSTKTGSTYNADAAITVYIDDLPLLAFSGIQLIDTEEETENLVITHGIPISLDRAWMRTGFVPPLTNADGSFTGGTLDLVYFDDFDGGDTSNWEAVTPSEDGLPYPISDIGGGGGFGLSSRTLANASTPYASASVMIKVMARGLVTVPPETTPFGCPVALLP